MNSNFTCPPERHKAGRYLALFLRELAPTLDMKVDSFGYVSIKEALMKMRCRIPELTMDHIGEIVEKDPQHRFEIHDDKIRAKAGHRFPVEVPWSPCVPPKFLYHGTK